LKGIISCVLRFVVRCWSLIFFVGMGCWSFRGRRGWGFLGSIGRIIGAISWGSVFYRRIVKVGSHRKVNNSVNGYLILGKLT
jgi:hypothetical protein